MSASVQIVRCEKHGLAYNAAVSDGCARCRKERQGAVAGGTTTASASLGPQVAVAAVLILGSGLTFFGAHRELVATYGELLATARLLVGSSSAIDNELIWLDHLVADDEVQRRAARDPVLQRLLERLADPDYRDRLRRDPAAANDFYAELEARLANDP